MKMWKNIKSEFNDDGSLRDIYIENIKIEVWNSFLTNLKSSNFTYTFKNGDNSIDLPDNFEKIKKLQNTEPTLLTVNLNNKINVNCHFFIENEIEMDISPREINNSIDYQNLIEYISWLSTSLSKRVTLTYENSPEELILELDSRI